MRGRYLKLITGLLAAVAAQAPTSSWARPAAALFEPGTGGALGGGPAAPVPGVLQCVPFARDTSGIRLYGDAHTWWSQAEGKYARGRAPKAGAVMAIQPHGGSTLGHVATVRRVIDSRTILIDHANWSAPGKIERNVTAVDVSPDNDWSEVRVWYAPIQSLGGAHWPVSGFIYNARPGKAALLAKSSAPANGSQAASAAKPTMIRYVPSKTVKVRFGFEPMYAGKSPVRIVPARVASGRAVAARTTLAPKAAVGSRKDPIGAILASAR